MAYFGIFLTTIMKIYENVDMDTLSVIIITAFVVLLADVVWDDWFGGQ